MVFQSIVTQKPLVFIDVFGMGDEGDDEFLNTYIFLI
jgi:hypothetical protein